MHKTFASAFALFMIAGCAAPSGTYAPRVSSAVQAESRTLNAVASVEIKDKWKLSPIMLRVSQGCFDNVPSTIFHKQPAALASNGLCSSAVLAMSSLDHLTQCVVTIGAEIKVQQGIDTACHAFIRKDGIVEINYQLLAKYRPGH